MVSRRTQIFFMGSAIALPCCLDRGSEEPLKSLDTAPRQTAHSPSHVDESVRTLVRKLKTTETSSIDLSSFGHPWATKPRSVASQAALTIAARVRRSSSTGLVEAFLKAGCLDPLIILLANDEHVDQQDAAIIALHAMLDGASADSPLDALKTKGPLVNVCRIMASPGRSEGARMTCASIAHCLIQSDRALRLVFISSGGLETLVKLLELDMKRGGDTQYMHWILERVNDLHDLLEDTNGKVDETVAKQLSKLGARSRLERLKMSGFTDLREDAQTILQLLRVY
jgi:hypothetical protein